jgi:hypothetical protein
MTSIVEETLDFHLQNLLKVFRYTVDILGWGGGVYLNMVDLSVTNKQTNKQTNKLTN